MATGIANIKGGAGGGGETLQITKTYTIGYANVQAITFNGLNEGISEHCLIAIHGSSSNISANSFTNSAGMPATSDTITDSVKYNIAGIYGIGKTINFDNSNTGVVRVVSFNDNGTTKYGLAGRGDSSTATDLGLIITIRVKPFALKNGDTITTGTCAIKGTLRLLCWNKNTNAYETIEWTDVVSGVSSQNYKYKYNGYLQFSLANNYILCGVLEASAYGYSSSNPTYTTYWLTESDIE